ncbi:hypothetical protein, partial [Pedococcus sp. 2YAF34]|uniref:hypothetical protein n=1 Tax=Pedococcus sp. 2YAF34 TaxID=3233032 RepID=UPI003F95CA78
MTTIGDIPVPSSNTPHVGRSPSPEATSTVSRSLMCAPGATVGWLVTVRTTGCMGSGETPTSDTDADAVAEAGVETSRACTSSPDRPMRRR